MWIAVTYRKHPYYGQEWTVIHEMGHYLGHRTALINRSSPSIAADRDWLIDFCGCYCDESNHEFIAESFAVYVLWPEELQANAPAVYAHIEMCLHEIKSDSEDYP